MLDVSIETVINTKKNRPIADFICQEMFFEHAQGMLDENRRIAVEDFLRRSPVAQAEYAKLVRGVEFCRRMSSVRVPAEVLAQVADYRHVSEEITTLVIWKNWPDGAKTFLQSTTVALVTAFFVTLLPWEKIPILSDSEVDKTIELVKMKAVREAEDEPLPLPETKLESTPVAIIPAEPAKVPVKEKIEAVKARPTEVAVTAKKVIPPPETQGSTGHLGGFVYRATMRLSQLDAKSQEIAQKIESFGGTKAGKVDLGWKNKGGRYFHFALPESQNSALLTYLRSLSAVQLSKDPHQRVMSEGVVRFILWVEDADKK